MQYSIVIPAYNEEATIRAGKLQRVSKWLAEQQVSAELIVVDDGSKDETASLARTIADRVITIPHSGKAAALVAGITQARGEAVLLTDMDQATPITEACKVLDLLPHLADIAVGSRGLVRRGAPVRRYVLSWGQVVLRTLLLGLRITDTQCGFKAMLRLVAQDVLDNLVIYRPERLHNLVVPSVTSGFDVEFLFVAKRLGYRIREVPVEWNYQETRRVNLMRDAWRGIGDLARIRAMALGGKYPQKTIRNTDGRNHLV